MRKPRSKKPAKSRPRRRRFDSIEDAHRWKLSLLTSWIARHGWSRFRTSLVVAPGVAIGDWVRSRRKSFSAGKLAPWLRDALETIPGWSWDFHGDRARANLERLRIEVRTRGWDGISEDLKSWVERARMAHRESVETEDPIWTALERIPGWSWNPIDERVSARLARLRRVVATRGWKGIVADGDLAAWLEGCRSNERSGQISASLRRQLESIPGWRWARTEEIRAANAVDEARRRAEILRAFVRSHGWEGVQLGRRRTVFEGFRLGDWITEIRRSYRQRKLPSEIIAIVEGVSGWSWDPAYERRLDSRRRLDEFLATDPRNSVAELLRWRFFIQSRRAEHAQGRLPPWAVTELERIRGWTWGAATVARPKSQSRLAEDIQTFRDFMTRQRGRFTTDELLQLIAWINNQKASRAKR